MQAVIGLIGERQSLFQRADRLQNHDRAKYFLLPYLAFEAYVFKDGRVKQRAFPLVAKKHLSPPADSFLHRLFRTLCRCFRDHRAYVSGFVRLVTNHQLAGLCNKFFSECLIDLGIDQDSLGTNTVLPCRPVRTGNARFHSGLKITIAHNDDWGIATEIHGHLLQAGGSRDLLAGNKPTGKRNHAYCAVRNQGFSELGITGSNRNDFCWQTGFVQAANQLHR
ncbi:hypothetical protein D3C79_772870 [compost metagenome]